jgi:hypothetical protein
VDRPEPAEIARVLFSWLRAVASRCAGAIARVSVRNPAPHGNGPRSVFPDGLLPGRRWIVVLVVSLAIQIPTVALTTVREYRWDISYLEARAQAKVDPSALEVALWNTPLFVAGLIGVLSLLVRWRHGSRLIRQQIAWLGAASSITIVLFMLGYAGQD